MTNEAAIARVLEKLPTVRLNKDGTPNGNALHGYYASLKSTFKKNGMDHNDACRAAARVVYPKRGYLDACPYPSPSRVMEA